MDTPTTIALIIAILAFCGLVFLMFERYRARKLRARFGPEYDRTLAQAGTMHRARTILDHRQKRVAKYEVRELTAQERDRFLAEWNNIQNHFVDDPQDAIKRADALVTQAVQARGYPGTDFETTAADLSVNHPHAVADYRIACEIMRQNVQGQATTENLRRAMQHYRALFEAVANTGWVREEVHA